MEPLAIMIMLDGTIFLLICFSGSDYFYFYLCVYIYYMLPQLQEEKEDVQRKLVILQDDLEKSEARADEYRKEAEEKATALDETERSAELQH